MAPPFAMNATINPLLHWPTTAALAWNPRYIGRKSAGWVRDARVRDAFYPFLRMSESRGEEMADAKHKLWIRRNFGSGLLCNAVAGKKEGTKTKGVGKSQKTISLRQDDQRPATNDQRPRVQHNGLSSESVPPNRAIYAIYLRRSLRSFDRHRDRNKCKHTLQSAPNLVYLF